MSPDEKENTREIETVARKRLRDGICPDKKVKVRKKETIGRKRLRDGMSPDKKVKMREKETIGRKRLSLAKNDINDFECMKEAKHIYTGLKILKMLTNIHPLYVSFAID
jgi:hypothetical protein